MATDKFPELKELTLKANNKGIISFIANGLIPMWASVRVVAPPSVGDLPLIEITSGANDISSIGIAVGGSGTPVNPDGTTGNAADTAGDIVDVAVLNSAVITKARVNAGTNALAIGENLISGSVNGFLIHSLDVTPEYVVAKALQPSTLNGDTILVFMGGGH